MKDRIQLAKYFNEKGYKIGAEIGVADGRYSEILVQNIPDVRLILVDPWVKYDGNWRSDDYQKEAFQIATDRLSKYDNKIKFIRSNSIPASLTIEDESLDFVFIDGNHRFDYVMEDIIAWSRKVRKGGIVSGHDYYHFKTGGVVKAVNSYCEAHEISLNLTEWNYNGHKDDRCPCWWWEKK